MNQINNFPKIFTVTSRYLKNLLKGKVEITEKVDGSQFCFGVNKKGEVVMRSKGKELFYEDHAKMFELAVKWVKANQKKILALGKNRTYYCEFLNKPKHNVLTYSRPPENNIILFGVMIEDDFISDHKTLSSVGASLGLETVPLLYHGLVKDIAGLTKYLDKVSVLGKEKIEGIVVKNYNEVCVLGSRIVPAFGKLVRDEFKERHLKDKGDGRWGNNKLMLFIESFKSEARWQKAVQHLRDNDQLVDEPKDIGILLKELERDLLEEETENIKQRLFKLFKDRIVRKAKAGFPEWYKKSLFDAPDKIINLPTPKLIKEEK